jgi:hypothetical protein
MMNYLADLVWKAVPRVSAREKQTFIRGLKRNMQRLVPTFLNSKQPAALRILP